MTRDEAAKKCPNATAFIAAMREQFGEVKVLYVGLAQAYYVSARGEAGVGRPSEDGWKWEPLKKGSREVLAAQEIFQGKQTPAFVPLPVKIQ